MATSDVFRNISERILIFQNKNWSDVPDKPGVYAWFYPITVNSLNLDELLAEQRAIRNYDSSCGGIPSGNSSLPLNWYNLELKASIVEKDTTLPKGIEAQWDKIIKDPQAFSELRKTLLVSSLMMPPLYIGKTKSLMGRCAQHRGTRQSSEINNSPNTFKKRFEAFANETAEIRTNQVEDLIMACVLTSDTLPIEHYNKGSDNAHSLVEEILKISAKPAYGIR